MDNKKLIYDVKSKFYEYEFQLKIYFEDKIYGVYIYKNNTLKENKCIEFMTIIADDFTKEEFCMLESIHKKLKFTSMVRGNYITLKNIGKSDLHMKPYIYLQNETLKKGYSHIDNFTWWALKNYGVGVKSPSVDKLNIRISYKELLENIDYNLNCYWGEKVKSKIIFLSDYWVQFSVLAVCRILYFVQNKKELSKINSMDIIADYIPSEFRNIVLEAIRIKKHSGKSIYSSRLKRQNDTKKFIKFGITFFNSRYFINRNSNIMFL
ncbi:MULTISPECIES: aminoglycoside adenylyltransferase domain-containing protein [Clostridium]|uniref:aminoglycoside adenylyltransferase domain-containing protein n=1 Tax=Clostridium TaxID=1485 RepID=UPI000825C37A|nr:MULTISPECIES: aminoglycoside adenylyltransferase domain-containing protein [Clostridium]